MGPHPTTWETANKILVAIFKKNKTTALFFTTGIWQTCSTSCLGQSPPSDQPNQNKQQSTGFLITSLSWIKILQIVWILQDWNICFQPETKQNYQQLHKEHHTTQHKALSPDRFMLPRCKLSKDTHIWLKKISFQKQRKKSMAALIP